MYARDYKQFAPGEYYHVFNRGNAKADIFLDAEDYRLFLHRLAEGIYPSRQSTGVKGALSQRNQRKLLPDGAFSLITYCLMPNHFHLLLRQNTELPISTLMLKICTSYCKIFNKKYDRVGSLFQDQFKTVHVTTNEQLLHLSAYIHLNPKTAKLVRNAVTYPYSSYKEYASGKEGLCEKSILLEQSGGPREYRILVDTTWIREKSAVKGHLSHYE